MLARYRIVRGERPSDDPLPGGVRVDTRRHTRHVLRPTPEMVAEVLDGGDFERFRAAYRELLDERFAADPQPFDQLAERARQEDVHLGCSCPTKRQPACRDATQVAAGSDHVCALVDGGEVFCWGANTYGQLGDGTGTGGRRPTPGRVVSISGATAIGAGQSHTCAVLSGGTIRCWGQGHRGQLGDGGTDNQSTPVTVDSVTNAVSVAGASLHSCAVLTDGTITCWGEYPLGPLPDVSSLSGVTLVDAGGWHTCALTASAPTCWGPEFDGELGDGVGSGGVDDPVDPFPGADSSASTLLTAGGRHACAVVPGDAGAADTAYCWGNNSHGQLGLGEGGGPLGMGPLIGGHRDSPEQVDDTFVDARSITAGTLHTCIALGDGSVRCWGSLPHPDPTQPNVSTATPTTVSGVSNAAAVTAGAGYTCALSRSGAVRCWGENEDGQLGDGTTMDRSTPVPVTGP